MEVAVLNTTGDTVSQLQISDYVFNIPVNTAVMHQVLVAQNNNARLGTANTKTRSEVTGSTRKLFAQKHTGRARRGSIKSPLLKGGGIVFGPHPRSYKQKLNKKMKSLAIRSALSSKTRENQFLVLDELKVNSPKTKEIINVMKNLGISSTVLFVTTQPSNELKFSARNVPEIKVLPLDSINLADLLKFNSLAMTVDAIRKAEDMWGQQEPGDK
ncbi:MAG: 50S ribosomal protein L4 [Dehalococcoidia bacterium]|nr:50S ribosomal protein L4 [Dehalococcoidia bacterium]